MPDYRPKMQKSQSEDWLECKNGPRAQMVDPTACEARAQRYAATLSNAALRVALGRITAVIFCMSGR